jgi:probable F420-dependent oxidoreductase
MSNSSIEWWLNLTAIDLDHLIPIARAAEAAGFTGVSLGDHLFFPERVGSPYPYTADGSAPWKPSDPWPDCWVTIAAMAAATARLRFTTGVYIAPLRHPIVLAKAIGTVARLFPGRVVAGFGAGWLREEFDILGEQFDRRGRRMDEMLALMRRLWTGEMVEFHGEFYDLPPITMSPPPREAPLIFIGGHGEAALRRACNNEGWIGVHRSFEDTEDALRTIAAIRAESKGARPFTVMLNVLSPSPEDAQRFQSLGVDSAVLPLMRVASGPRLGDQLDAIEATAERLGLGSTI